MALVFYLISKEGKQKGSSVIAGTLVMEDQMEKSLLILVNGNSIATANFIMSMRTSPKRIPLRLIT